MEKLDNYFDLAQQIYDGCIISDPWLNGKKRFSLEPITIERLGYKKLSEAAERVGKLYDEFAKIVWDNPNLLGEYFHLTPYQKLMWLSSNGHWHGISRLDVFKINDGSLKVCEMNSDTPSGEAEAVVLNEIFYKKYKNFLNPNKDFEKIFCSMILELYKSVSEKSDPPSIGILYPTEMPEDLSMIAIYKKWFENLGFVVTLGSPYNLRSLPNNEVSLFNTKIDIIFRHYKTDWWGERLKIWYNEEELPDPEPLDYQIKLIIESELANKLAIVNPLGAVLTQNKLSISFFWEKTNLFSSESVKTIKELIPETYKIKTLINKDIKKDEWVLKSDYGCEGSEVIIGLFVSQDVWDKSLKNAIPEHWILQKFFDAEKNKNGETPNYGVYLIGGIASGIFTRLSKEGTDYHSITAPTFVVN